MEECFGFEIDKNRVTGNSVEIWGTYSYNLFSAKCAVCAGPPEACEIAFYEDDCRPPNHYCINHISNLDDGRKLVNRR